MDNQKALLLNMRITIIYIIIIILVLGIGIVIGTIRGIPFVKSDNEWSIGIYKGDTPFILKETPNNPVITATDVSDTDADFVADPFIWYHDGKWAIFFEILNNQNNQGDIAVATSEDGKNFKYRGIVINENWHLSYPQLFEHDGIIYMIPESHEDKSLHLYCATEYPLKWEHVKTLLRGRDFIDSNIFNYNGMWWILSTTTKHGDVLRLYYCRDLMGLWREHPQSPILVESPRIARGGGNVIKYCGKIYRYAQDCSSGGYATNVRAVEIITLTPTDYKEKELDMTPIVSPSGFGWNQLAMHHIAIIPDPNGGFVASTDGLRPVKRFGLKY